MKYLKTIYERDYSTEAFCSRYNATLGTWQHKYDELYGSAKASVDGKKIVIKPKFKDGYWDDGDRRIMASYLLKCWVDTFKSILGGAYITGMDGQKYTINVSMGQGFSDLLNTTIFEDGKEFKNMRKRLKQFIGKTFDESNLWKNAASETRANGRLVWTCNWKVGWMPGAKALAEGVQAAIEELEEMEPGT